MIVTCQPVVVLKALASDDSLERLKLVTEALDINKR